MHKASQEFAERTLRRWRVNKQMVDAQTEILINGLAKQTSEEYFQLNDVERLEENLSSHGIRVNADQLRKEIKKGDCQLLKIASPPSGSQRSKYSSSEPEVVRCLRIIRVVMHARTNYGMRTLVEDHESKSEDVDHYPTAKVSMDAGDAESAWPSVLQSKLGLPDPWLRQLVTLSSCAETVVEVQASSSFPGLPTWYIVDEVIVNVNEEGDKNELKLLGLPNGDQFRGTGKHRHRTWLWADFGKRKKSTRSSSSSASKQKSQSIPSTASPSPDDGNSRYKRQPLIRTNTPSSVGTTGTIGTIGTQGTSERKSRYSVSSTTKTQKTDGADAGSRISTNSGVSGETQAVSIASELSSEGQPKAPTSAFPSEEPSASPATDALSTTEAVAEAPRPRIRGRSASKKAQGNAAADASAAAAEDPLGENLLESSLDRTPSLGRPNLGRGRSAVISNQAPDEGQQEQEQKHPTLKYTTSP
jgi:hypothetical protein